MVSGVVTEVASADAMEVPGETLVAAENVAAVTLVDIEDVAGVAVVEPCCAFLPVALILAFLGTPTGLAMPSGISIKRILRSKAISLLPTVNCQGIGTHFPGTGCANPSDQAVCTSSFTVPSRR